MFECRWVIDGPFKNKYMQVQKTQLRLGKVICQHDPVLDLVSNAISVFHKPAETCSLALSYVFIIYLRQNKKRGYRRSLIVAIVKTVHYDNEVCFNYHISYVFDNVRQWIRFWLTFIEFDYGRIQYSCGCHRGINS